MKIKNLKLFLTRTLLTITIGTTAFNLSSCGKKNELKFKEVVEKVSDDKNIDEILDEDVINVRDFNDNSDDLSLMNSVLELEKCLKITKELNNVKFSDNIKMITDIDKQEEIMMLDEKDVEPLLDTYKKSSKAEKIDAAEKLLFMKTYTKDYILKNGLNISEELLLDSIKSITTDVLDLDYSEYKNLSMCSEKESNIDKNTSYLYHYNNHEYDKYEIEKSDDVYYIYNLQRYIGDLPNKEMTDNEFKQFCKTCEKSLKYSKQMITKSVYFDKDKVISLKNNKK